MIDKPGTPPVCTDPTLIAASRELSQALRPVLERLFAERGTTYAAELAALPPYPAPPVDLGDALAYRPAPLPKMKKA